MAISTPIGNFLLVGIKNLLVKSKTAPYSVVGDLDTLTELTLSNEEAKAEKRWGYGNPVKYTLYGDVTTTLTGAFGTMSADLMRIMTGNVKSVKTVAVDVIDKGLAVTSSTATLTKGTPSTGKPLTVYVADAYGRNSTLLSAGNPTSDPTKYSISGSTITVNEAVTKINVYYMTDKEIEAIEAKPSTHNIYEMSGICVCQDPDTGALFRGSIEIPSAQMGSSYQLGVKNSSDVPDDQTVAITCLHDSTAGYPYRILLEEVSSANF